MGERIEICGNIATGKTSLATAFFQTNSNIVFEDFSKIAMLDDFYSNPRLFSFETEMAFTLQHYYQFKKQNLIAGDAIADFSFAADYAFALANLNDEQLQVYRHMFEYIVKEIGKPKLLVKLSATPQTLQKRIRLRNRLNELNISTDYLEEINRQICLVIDTVYSDVTVCEINTDNLDLTGYTADFLNEIVNRPVRKLKNSDIIDIWKREKKNG
jgi:deoxyadenosine/deoxycytidine kinase